MYFFSDYILKKVYKDIRGVIQYTSQNKEVIIKDGDLGLLIDEVNQLKNRSDAYEKTLNKEKDKLRKTIEDICHQLKTPLTSISIYTELSLEKDNNNPYLKEINQQIDKMKYLIQSLLRLAKLQSHQINFEYEYLSVNNLINISLQSLHSLIQKSDVDINITEQDISFYYDEDWLQEAFSNIIKNSLEHNSSIIDISFKEYKEYLKIYIHNNGDEVSKKDLPHIFERFYHASHQEGVGIGLALSKEIIERHHGQVEVYNQAGVVFEVTFPKYQVSQKYKVS